MKLCQSYLLTTHLKAEQLAFGASEYLRAVKYQLRAMRNTGATSATVIWQAYFLIDPIT
jgi:hypothetical protein